MKTCVSCGKQFTPRHGAQKMCKSCKTRKLKKTEEVARKRREAGELRKKYGVTKGTKFRCNLFPNCEECPFPDCIDCSDRIYGKELTDG